MTATTAKVVKITLNDLIFPLFPDSPRLARHLPFGVLLEHERQAIRHHNQTTFGDGDCRNTFKSVCVFTSHFGDFCTLKHFLQFVNKKKSFNQNIPRIKKDFNFIFLFLITVNVFWMLM